MRRCYSSLRLSRLSVLACLGSFLAIHLMWMAAEVCGLSARCAVCLLACPVVSVPCRPSRLVARPLHPMARSIDAARLRGHDVMVRVRVRGRFCHAVRSHRPPPIALLRELVKTARADGFLASAPVPIACGLLFSSPCRPVLARVLAWRLACASRLFPIRISPRPYDMRGGAIFPVAVVFSVRSY